MDCYPAHFHFRLPLVLRSTVENVMLLWSVTPSINLPPEILFVIFSLLIESSDFCFLCCQPVTVPIKLACNCSVRYCLTCFRDHFQLDSVSHSIVKCLLCYKQASKGRGRYQVDQDLIQQTNVPIPCPRACGYFDYHNLMFHHLRSCPNNYVWYCSSCNQTCRMTKQALIRHLEETAYCNLRHHVCPGCADIIYTGDMRFGETISWLRHLENCSQMQKCAACWLQVPIDPIKRFEYHNGKCHPLFCRKCHYQFATYREIAQHELLC